jgi:uncharacterized membrane protein YagU involved in acid resistance
MIWLGSGAQKMMEEAGANGGAGVWGFTGWWFALVFLCATQDIAVDGWALTLLSPSNLSYASTAQTVGLTAGQFLSYTVFLALSSPDFANKYFRSAPQEAGLFTLDGYLIFWGWAYLAVTLGLALLKREERTKEKDSIMDVYKVMGGIMKLRNVQIFIVIHLIAKIGFQANDAVTNLKLLDKGFSQEDLALTVLIDFPFEIFLGYYAGMWSEKYQPIRVWCWAFVGRLAAAVFAQLVVMAFPAAGTTTPYLLTVIVEHVFSTFMSTVMFVAISAFHAKIADPAIGGTYMTLLATYVSRSLFDCQHRMTNYFTASATSAAHSPGSSSSSSSTLSPSPPVTHPPILPKWTPSREISLHSLSAACKKSRSTAVLMAVVLAIFRKMVRLEDTATSNLTRDSLLTAITGYYLVNVMCVLVGAITFFMFIRPQALKLQQLPMRAWRISEN